MLLAYRLFCLVSHLFSFLPIPFLLPRRVLCFPFNCQRSFLGSIIPFLLFFPSAAVVSFLLVCFCCSWCPPPPLSSLDKYLFWLYVSALIIRVYHSLRLSSPPPVAIVGFLVVSLLLVTFTFPPSVPSPLLRRVFCFPYNCQRLCRGFIITFLPSCCWFTRGLLRVSIFLILGSCKEPTCLLGNKYLTSVLVGIRC